MIPPDLALAPEAITRGRSATYVRTALQRGPIPFPNTVNYLLSVMENCKMLAMLTQAIAMSNAANGKLRSPN